MSLISRLLPCPWSSSTERDPGDHSAPEPWLYQGRRNMKRANKKIRQTTYKALVRPTLECTSPVGVTCLGLLHIRYQQHIAKKYNSKQSDGSCTITAKLPAVTWGWMTCTIVTNSEIQNKECHTDLLVLQILPGSHPDQHQAQITTVQLLNDLSLYRTAY